MESLEQGLRRLASKMTGKPVEEIPMALESIVSFMADNTGSSEPEPEPESRKSK